MPGESTPKLRGYGAPAVQPFFPYHHTAGAGMWGNPCERLHEASATCKMNVSCQLLPWPLMWVVVAVCSQRVGHQACVSLVCWAWVC